MNTQCQSCRDLRRTYPSVTRDCDELIREYVGARGYAAAAMLTRLAEDAERAYHYDVDHTRQCCRDRAPASLRAYRRYALAAWAMRRLEAAYYTDRAERVAAEQALEGLPLASAVR